MKIFFIILSVYKQWQINIIKNTIKSFEKNHVNDIKISKEEKDKRQKKARERYQNLSEEEKQKLLEFMRNYYLAHKKYIFSCFVGFFNFKAVEKKQKTKTRTIKNEFSYQVFQVSPWYIKKFKNVGNVCKTKTFLLWNIF